MLSTSSFVPPLRSGFLNLGVLLAAVMVACPSDANGQSDEQARAKEILDATGIEGGLIVHLGCGEGRLTAALAQNEGLLVQGLDPESQNVTSARRHIRSLGTYGQVTADQLRGRRLPLADAERMRVLQG